MNDEIKIEYLEEQNQSVAVNDEGVYIGYCEYEIKDNNWVITHTVVSPLYGGRGIAKQLVLRLVEEARKRNIKILPICSYAVKVLLNKEFADILL